jgi:hypothetical protein
MITNTILASTLLVPAGFAALGMGLLALSLGRWGMQVYHAWMRRRTWLTLEVPGDAAEDKGAVSPDELYDLPPLLPWLALSAGVGWILGQALLSGPARNLGALAICLPILWKQQRIREGQRQVQQEIARLVEDLRLYLAFASTPGAALRFVIADAPEGILWTQLRRQRDTVLAEGAETALENVAVVLNAPTLRRLVTRVKAAQAGSTALSAALQAATEELTQDLRREMEEQVEAAPTRLLIPMLVMLLMPLLIIVLTPPVQMLLDTLAGVGPTPLGG